MKSTLLPIFCVTFLMMNSSSSSWIGLEKANRTNIKKYEKHCLGIIYHVGPMEEGEVRRIPGTCAQATCLRDRSIHIAGCPLVAINDRVGCRVYGGDLTEEYPQCCHEIRCGEADANGTIYDGFINMTAFDVRHKAKKKEEDKEKPSHS